MSDNDVPLASNGEFGGAATERNWEQWERLSESIERLLTEARRLIGFHFVVEEYAHGLGVHNSTTIKEMLGALNELLPDMAKDIQEITMRLRDYEVAEILSHPTAIMVSTRTDED